MNAAFGSPTGTAVPDPTTARRAGGFLARPSVWLVAALLPCAVLLALPLKVAIGSFYWDLAVYLDGAYRVLRGQVPSVDFFAPVGPLSYWLVAALQTAFPKGQTLLLVGWCLLPVGLPLMAATLAGFERRSPALAWLVAGPFLLLQVVPLNVEQFTFYSSFDGFGIYNRQTSGLLYVLVTALLFVENRRLLTGLVAGLCLALFLLKITGFAVALALCSFAWIAGRLRWAEVWRAALLFACALGLLELATGVVSAYLRDLVTLLSLNRDTLASRWIRAGSTHAAALTTLLALAGALIWLQRDRLRQDLARLTGARRGGALAAIADSDPAWLLATALTGWFLETQNTGGHAFVFAWPVLARIGLSGAARHRLVALLIAAAVLPPLVGILGRAARATIASVTQPRLDEPLLGPLGRVAVRPDDARNARLRGDAYGRSNTTQELFLADGGSDNFDTFSSPEFQVLWLQTLSEAASAVRALEERSGRRFASILNVGYLNPFPALLDRDAPRLAAIGADPTRTTPRPDAAILASLAATDLLLLSHCPATDQTKKLAALYDPVLRTRQPIRLSPCWQAYPREPLGLAGR